MTDNVTKLNPAPTIDQAVRMSIEDYLRNQRSFLHILQFAAATKVTDYGGSKLLRDWISGHLENAEDDEVLGFITVLTDLAASLHWACERNGLQPPPWPVHIDKVVVSHAEDLGFHGWSYDEANDQVLKFYQDRAD